MPLAGQGALVIWHGITAEGEADMLRWHNTEHIPERVSIPGFHRGRRYVDVTRPHQYLDVYETESVETIRSAPYLARLNNPTPWTSRVLPHFRDTVRLGCRVVASVGRGQGGALLTVRLAPAPGRERAMQQWLTGAGLATLAESPGIVAVHVLETVPETTQIRTAEIQLRGGDVTLGHVPWPLILLVEANDVEALDALTRGALGPAELTGHGAGPETVFATLRLHVTMDAA